MTDTDLRPAQACEAPQADAAARTGVTRAEIIALYALSLPELLFRAQSVHRAHFDPTDVQISTLLSIKTGGCPEKCDYCPQSAHFDTGVKADKLMRCADVVAQARAAQQAGATRFCMGAAWRGPRDKQVAEVADMVRAVKALGMETCATLGLLQDGQAETLRDAGLDYYNHNIDTAPEYYSDVIGTRSFADRLDTLDRVRGAGLKVCCGGIVGMNETREQRAGLLEALANMPSVPESVPINWLVKVSGTPLADADALDPFEFVRTIAIARILMPSARVRLSAGRQAMSDELQALCFFAGANSIFYGDKLLTTDNPDMARDVALLDRLGMQRSRLAMAQSAP
jgi:biotin synthase